MERLSKELTNIINEQDFCFTQDEMKTVERALGMYRAYEDTGLEPEEIERLQEYMKPFTIQDMDRFREIMDAEKDGRLVVLPCKVGDTVYEIEPLWFFIFGDKDAKCRSCKDFYEGGMGDLPCCLRKDEDVCLSISEKTATLSMIADWMDHAKFGKTVFLASQDAEEALRKEADNG